ncbi:hypothetical protein MJG53_006411 [Ovis ammon polii x Ovis aries]|uniref:Uncharacterized protein n=1 Tax=Ovis ammon polii x Ovis aries TaxID=2918886 RepID=A0ACB9V550_9CETA|nr:hypothetical protein MJG53_006411 [Ovis ammon polii x Ovis aries]
MKASVCGDLSLAVGVRVFVVLFTPFHLFDKLKDVQPIQAESSFEKILTGTKINRFFTTQVKYELTLQSILQVLPQEREVTGTLMTFFLALGLSCGASLSFLFKALL